jgi:TolB-like protein/tetratricopeptide (TPR) repeat protein
LRERLAALLYSFERFLLDTDTRELSRNDNLVSVEPKVFDLLSYLIVNRSRVVSKDDLIATVWSGRIVSESALTTCINAARVAVGDSGDTQRLIKTFARKGIRFIGTVQELQAAATGSGTDAPAQKADPAMPLPDKPSIAVLPFANLSSDPEQDYFADGVVEDIITALSRFKSLFVIARNSSFTYKGRAVDVKQVGRELGVRYVLEGSVRKAADRVRITGQLVDTATGTHLWAERFDGGLNDIFDLQDQVTATIVSAIAPRIEHATIERINRKPTEQFDAYDYYLQGAARFNGRKPAEARELFLKAIECDPNYAVAYAMAAICIFLAAGLPLNSAQITEVTRLAKRAVELDKDDAGALAISGYMLALVARDLGGGAALIDRAIMLNPNLALAWTFGGWAKIHLGESEISIERFARALRLSPFGPQATFARCGTAHGHFLLGHYQEAASWAAIALQDNPDYQAGLRIQAASNAMAGRPEQAREAMTRLRQLNPALRVSTLKDATGPYRVEDFSRYQEGLRQAGLPE